MIPQLFRFLKTRIADKRPPNFVIQTNAVPYLKRWYVIPRNRFFNIYLHQFVKSDIPGPLHDHMYFNLSILLKGVYTEHTILAGGINRRTFHRAGTWSGVRFRSPWKAHRVELAQDNTVEIPCWSLFITGPRIRNWGFHCPKGWMRWQDYTVQFEGGNNNKGCEE